MTKYGTDEGSGPRGPAAPDARCRWCRRALPPRSGPGRPRRFCRRSCRQRDYEARRRASELALGEGGLVVAREALDALRDDLYVLSCAVEDVERDLAEAVTVGPAELQAALEWLLAAARPACSRSDPLGAS